MRLKNTLSQRLKQVITLLKSRNNPVALTTAYLLESKEVHVRYFSSLTRNDLLLYFADLANRRFSKKGLVRAAGKDSSGLFVESNSIYIENQWTSLEKLTLTLVHECNHYLNQHDPDTPHHNFLNEYKAFIAEEMAKGKRLTRSATKKIEEKVKRAYPEFQPDPHIETPEGIYFIVSKRKNK